MPAVAQRPITTVVHSFIWKWCEIDWMSKIHLQKPNTTNWAGQEEKLGEKSHGISNVEWILKGKKGLY